MGLVTPDPKIPHSAGRRGGVVSHILVSEFPPDCGGVGHYTQQLVRGLRQRGEQVIVWHPQFAGDDPESSTAIKNFRGLLGWWKLARRLGEYPKPRRILLQYVPHGWGCKAMNLPLCLWLLWRARVRGDHLDVMFHEVAMPWAGRPLRHKLQAILQRMMAGVLLLGARRAFVSTPAFVKTLDRCRLGGRPIEWVPVPSNIGKVDDPRSVEDARRELSGGQPDVMVVGHFGTFGGTVGQLTEQALARLLECDHRVRVALLGRGADACRTRLEASLDTRCRGRSCALENLTEERVSIYLQACDLMLQPYTEGITARRSTAMAALANGVALVTCRGPLSEDLWQTSGAIGLAESADVGELTTLATRLLNDSSERRQLAEAGQRLYERSFTAERTVNAMLENDMTQAPGLPREKIAR